MVALKRKAENPDYTGTDAQTEDELIPREIPVTIRYTDPEDGNQLETTVTSRIMNATDRAVAARMVAQMAGGIPWDSLPPIQRGRFHALAVCSIQLRKPPDWLLKWISEDYRLLDAVYAECDKHESFFFRAGVYPGEAKEINGWLAVVSTRNA